MAESQDGLGLEAAFVEIVDPISKQVRDLYLMVVLALALAICCGLAAVLGRFATAVNSMLLGGVTPLLGFATLKFALEERFEATQGKLHDQQERLAQAQTQIGEVQKAVDQATSPAAAVASVKNIVSNAPAAPGSRWQEGQAAYQAGNVQKAREIWEDLTRHNPSYAPAWNSLGKYAEQVNNDRSAAGGLYQKAAASNYAPAFVNLGRLAEHERNWKEADSFCQQALKLRPDYAGARELAQRLKAHGFDCGL